VRLVQAQTYGREQRVELAQRWGVTERTVREAERSATIYLAPDRDDIERERVMMLARLAHTRKKALDAEDFRSVITAEAMIAKIGGLLQPLPPQVTTAPDAIGVEGHEERVAYCTRLLLTGRFRAFTTYADLAEAWGVDFAEVAELVDVAEQRIADVLGDGALRRVRVAAGFVDEAQTAGPVVDEGQHVSDEELYADLEEAEANRGATLARIRRRRALEAGEAPPAEPAQPPSSPAPPPPDGGSAPIAPDQPPPPPVRLGAVQPDTPAPAPVVEPPVDGFSAARREVFRSLPEVVQEQLVTVARAHGTTPATIVDDVIGAVPTNPAVLTDLDAGTIDAIFAVRWPSA
jgi:hypothetical protein